MPIGLLLPLLITQPTDIHHLEDAPVNRAIPIVKLSQGVRDKDDDRVEAGYPILVSLILHDLTDKFLSILAHLVNSPGNSNQASTPYPPKAYPPCDHDTDHRADSHPNISKH